MTATTKPRRAVLYGRVSKPDPRRAVGKGSVSVDRQITLMREQASRDQVDIIGIYRDDGISASRFAAGKPRDGWAEALNALVTADATELWTYEISRATRDRPVWASLINTCLARNILINVGGKLHDPADPDDGFMLDLQASLAVRESAVTSKRLKDDMKVRAAAGTPHGKIPYGYRREYDPRTRALLAQVPDPVTAPIVEEMARRVLAGESMYAVAADLNDRGVLPPEAVRVRRAHGEDVDVSGMKWLSGEVRDQLVSPTPAGFRVHLGSIVGPAAWPAIISPADHERLKAVITASGRQGWFGPTKHLLTGIAECGVCGTPLRRTKNRGYPSYSCPGPSKRGDSCVSRIQAPLDTMVEVRVVELLQDPELLLRAARLRAGDQVRASVSERELADLRATRAEYVAAAKKPGGLAAAAVLEIIADYDRQIEAAHARMGQVSGLPQIVLDMAGPDADKRWDAAEVVAHRQVVRAMVRVVVHRSSRRRGVRGFDPDTIEITPRWAGQDGAGAA